MSIFWPSQMFLIEIFIRNHVAVESGRNMICDCVQLWLRQDTNLTMLFSFCKSLPLQFPAKAADTSLNVNGDRPVMIIDTIPSPDIVRHIIPAPVFLVLIRFKVMTFFQIWFRHQLYAAGYDIFLSQAMRRNSCNLFRGWKWWNTKDNSHRVRYELLRCETESILNS